MAVTTRLCRGNFRSSWVASGRYDFVAEALFSGLVGCLGPGERLAAVVPGVDEGLDCGDEVFDRGEATAADGLAGEDRKEDPRYPALGPGTRSDFPEVPHVGVAYGAAGSQSDSAWPAAALSSPKGGSGNGPAPGAQRAQVRLAP